MQIGIIHNQVNLIALQTIIDINIFLPLFIFEEHLDIPLNIKLHIIKIIL